MTKAKVDCVAIRLPNGKIFSLPRPRRHCDVFRVMAKEDLKREDVIHSIQGFLLEDGTFVTRKQAKIIAQENNQLLDRASHLSILFSEDIF